MVAVAQKQIPEAGIMGILNARKDRFGTLSKAPLKYPDLFLFKIPGRTAYVIHQPEMVQHILQRNMLNYQKDQGYKVLALLLGNGLITNADNDSWRKQRKLLQPPFHRESLTNMCRIAVESVEELLKVWKTKEGAEINFTHDMAWLTIDIVCKTLFTSDVSNEQIQMVWRNLNFLNEAATKMASNPWHLPWKWPVPRYVKGRKYIAELNDMIYGIMKRRRQQSNPPNDLLQILLEARYDDGTPMSDEQIRDEVMTVFVAGHETTVNALSWTWYLLKKNPACEKKLFEENKRFAQANPTFADVAQMKYGWCVMNEAMRVYPPVPVIGRAVVTDEEVCGYHLKKNCSTIINIAGLHHHPAHWENPAQFNPERFLNFDLKGDNRFVFMPFGAGPRICIGNNFAMLEMQIINAMLSSRVEMELTSKEIEPEPLITLKPGNGVMVRIKQVEVR
ncbi:MAG: cytochrome P450 [Chitinophagales bacterium]|nr:cytochrome P450 [Chitinophagales bacterium]